MTNNSRLIKYDIVRTIAIFMVILCHATEAIYGMDLNSWQSLNLINKLFMIGAFTIGRLGVPLFLFLTGTLNLKKNISSKDEINHFYIHNLLPLFIVHVSWVFIYNFYFYIANITSTISIYNIFKEILFLKLVPLNHYWYIPMILSIYFAIPFISYIIHRINISNLKPILYFMFYVGFVIPFLNTTFLIFGINETFNTHLMSVSLGGTYGLYIILGYIISNRKSTKNVLNFILFFTAFLLMCMFETISYRSGIYVYNVWYDFPLLLICSLYLYNFLININYDKLNIKLANIIKYISVTSFFMYFCHFLLIKIFENKFLLLNIPFICKTLLLFLFISTISIVLGSFLKHIKPLKKYVMGIKH